MLIEPPKKFWFVMGNYLPPPYNLLLLAAIIEKEFPSIELKVIDCQAEDLDWIKLEERIKQEKPDIVGSGSHATCNVFTTIRTLDLAKGINPNIMTLTGGSHFTALDDATLAEFPVIDVITRYEADKTIVDLLKHFSRHGLTKRGLEQISGIAFISENGFIRTPDRPPLTNAELETLPFPAYHFVPLERYHFALMSDNPYIILEGSRGCTHQCSFCSQSGFYRRQWATKSVKRIVDEMEWMYNELGSRFFWFTDDNFCGGSPQLVEELCNELLRRGLNGDNIEWFAQMRVDSILKCKDILGLMNRAGNYWQLVGGESPFAEVLDMYQKGIRGDQTVEAIKLLRKHNILAQLMIVLGHEKETHTSIQKTMHWATEVVKPDIIISMLLTPYPGTPMFTELDQKGRIIDKNWTNYDMIHAVCDMEHLTAPELQYELYMAYRHVYDSWIRRFSGIFARNKYKRRAYWYYLRLGVIRQLKRLVPT